MAFLQILTLVTAKIPPKCQAHSSLTQRFFALFLDLLICKIASFFIILILSQLNLLHIHNPLSHLYSFSLEVDSWKMSNFKEIYFDIRNLEYFLIFFVTFTCYCTIFIISKQRTTIGKSIFKIIVVNHDGSGLNIGKAILRSSLIFISFLILPLGIINFLISFYSKERISLHDRICDTRVVNFH